MDVGWPRYWNFLAFSPTDQRAQAIDRVEALALRVLADRWPDFLFAFYDDVEIGTKMLARIAKHTGLQPNDL